MRVCADLGCIQESKMLPRLILDGNTTVRWQETYAMVPLALELPEEGTKKVGMSCPVCGEELQIKLASVARLHLLFTLAFWFITLVVAGIGVALYLVPGQAKEAFELAGLIAMGIAGGLAVSTLGFMFIKADFLGGIPDAMQIVDDPARAKGAELGYSGMKGHKLFKIHREV